MVIYCTKLLIIFGAFMLVFIQFKLRSSLTVDTNNKQGSTSSVILIFDMMGMNASSLHLSVGSLL